jgi:hypothetical protein
MSVFEIIPGTIRSSVYQPVLKDGKETNSLKYVKQVTHEEVKAQLIDVLKYISIPGEEYNALEGAESIFLGDRDNANKGIFQGRLIVVVRKGHNEGSLVEICVENNKMGGYEQVVLAKYLADISKIWPVGIAVELAIEKGLVY